MGRTVLPLFAEKDFPVSIGLLWQTCQKSNNYLLVVQLLSSDWLLVTPPTATHQAPLSSTISWSLLKFMSIESLMLSNHDILCFPLLLLPSIFQSIGSGSYHQVAPITKNSHLLWFYRTIYFKVLYFILFIYFYDRITMYYYCSFTQSQIDNLSSRTLLIFFKTALDILGPSYVFPCKF